MIVFTASEEAVLAAYFAAKVSKGDWPEAADVARKLGKTRESVYQLVSMIRRKGVAIGPGSGKRKRGAGRTGKPLTDKQESILAYMAEYHERMGIMPSLREINDHIGGPSAAATMHHIKALIAEGRIRHVGKYVARGYVLVKEVAV